MPELLRNMENLENLKKEIKTWKPNNCPCRLCKVYIEGAGFLHQNANKCKQGKMGRGEEGSIKMQTNANKGKWGGVGGGRGEGVHINADVRI